MSGMIPASYILRVLVLEILNEVLESSLLTIGPL